MNNNFRITLSQGDVILCESEINGNLFNPYTRSSVDIRRMLPDSISQLQRILSKKKYTTTYTLGKNYQSIDFYQYQLNQIELYPKYKRDGMAYVPESITQHIEGMTIKGVECKLGLYINDNTIVERVFYVNNFNPVSRWSIELLHTFNWIVEDIRNNIYQNDKKNIWDDFDLVSKKNLNIYQIRELSQGRRNELLRSINK